MLERCWADRKVDGIDRYGSDRAGGASTRPSHGRRVLAVAVAAAPALSLVLATPAKGQQRDMTVVDLIEMPSVQSLAVPQR